MKLTAVVLIVCVGAVPLAARDIGDGIAGPLARAGAREAARLAAEGAAAPAGQPQAGAPRPLELQWNELGPVITGRIVELTVPSGVVLRGEVISVRDDALLMDVRKSSEPGVHPTGSASIPRASVTVLTMERSRGSWGRNMGTIIGVLTGVVLGGYIAGEVADSAGTGIPLFLGIASGITVAGYYIGKKADLRVTAIRVTP